ncbi:MAG: glucosaminidase domain-containing protein [Muribaculaceae bacterium]|nr:glucosaminidase domain-containing protein [Muribaculaceae bacterium]
MMKLRYAIRCVACAVLMTVSAQMAEMRADAFGDYIEMYRDMALAEQERTGIPAAITLAQGLLESAAGRSALAREGNNHFGIKCHKEWEGKSMLRSDDAPDECFRVYDSAAESFADHSRFLQRRRYERLFEIPCEDYAAWARGLKECGYATDPQYAERLITIIERYGLATAGVPDAAGTADFIRSFLATAHVVRSSGELHYVVAVPGDTYSAIASELGMDAARLAAYNDAPDAGGIIKDWEEVWLQPKLDRAPADAPGRATIGEDESLHSLSQRFGITVEALRRLNPGAPDAPGTRLRLR